MERVQSIEMFVIASVRSQEVSVIDSTVEEAIELFRSYYTNPIEKETLLQLSNLESERKQRCEKLSGGQKKVKLCALAGNPDLLF